MSAELLCEFIRRFVELLCDLFFVLELLEFESHQDEDFE